MTVLHNIPTSISIALVSAIGIIASLLLAILPLHIVIAAMAIALTIQLAIRSPHVILTFLLVLSPLRTLIATESNLALPLDIGQILFVVYLGIWVIQHIYKRAKIQTVSFSILLQLLIGIVIIFGFNIWSSTSVSAWLTEWLKWCIITLFVWQIELQETKTWKWLIFAFLTSAVGNALIGIYIFFGGSGADHLVILGQFFRAFGTFGQPNPFGGFMGIALPVSIMCMYSQLVHIMGSIAKREKPANSSIIYLLVTSIATGILLAGLIASWSRGAWLGFGISSLVIAFAIPRKLSTSIVVASSTVFLIFALWLGGLIPQSIINRITTAATDFITIDEIRGVDITTVNYAVVERIAHWQAAINMAEAHPIIGVGLGNYEVVYEQYRLLNWTEPLGHAHNYYLNILAETGMIGFLAYSIFWIVVLWVTWRLRQHPDLFARSVGIGLLGSWTYIAVHSLFDNLYVNNLFLHIGLLLGILAVLNRQVWHTVTLE